MEVGDEDPVDYRWSNVSINKLPLRSFARIKKETLPIPAEQIAAMVAKTGRLLAGAA